MHDVFISYKSDEYTDALWVKNVLEENRISCWMAPESIPFGSSYAEQISYAIKACKVVVLILSRKSQSSIWVKKELDTALNNGKTVVPFAIENCKLEAAFDFYLCDVQRCNAYLDKARAMKEMIDRINAVIGVDKTPVESLEITAKENKKTEPAVPQIKDSPKTVSFGSFNAETLEWWEAEKTEDMKLLVCRDIIAAMPYNTEREDVTWETSTLRKWMNSEFFNNAFSALEKEQIVSVKNTNPNNPDYSTKGGNITSDKVFALSIAEAKKYFKKEEIKTVFKLRTNDVRVSPSGKYWWWLRTPGYNNRFAVSVDNNGNADYNGESVGNNGMGVRPCIWIKNNAL